MRDEASEGLWPQVRRVLVLQIKLYVDAFRDLLLSALALGALVIDLVLGNSSADSYVEKVFWLGRKSERAINLFNQYDLAGQGRHSVDRVLNEVENVVKTNLEKKSPD